MSGAADAEGRSRRRPRTHDPRRVRAVRRDWFDVGEVDRLRRLGAGAIEAHVTLTQEAYRKRCGSCDASYLRNADRCPAGKAPNVPRCPGCAELLEPVRTGATKLDVCRSCRGVWFDGVELKEIWNTALVQRRGMKPSASMPLRTCAIFMRCTTS